MEKHRGFIFLILLNLLPLFLFILYFITTVFNNTVAMNIVVLYVIYVHIKLHIIDTIILILYSIYFNIIKGKRKFRNIFISIISIIIMIAIDFWAYHIYYLVIMSV